jgi:hypothetical protein
VTWRVRLPADELGRLLRAHGYLRVQRPPTLWDLETAGLEQFVRALGELIAAGLVRNGGDLGALVLNVSNVHVAEPTGGSLPVGDLVAVSISGAGGDWTDARWAPGDPAFMSFDLPAALAAAGAVHAYSRRLGPDSGSVTVLYRRPPPLELGPTEAPECPRGDQG